MNVSTNIATAKAYLLSTASTGGKFAYESNALTGVADTSAAYNPLRHAGAIYALALSNQAASDPVTVAAITAAATYLTATYLGALPAPTKPPTTPIWSQPVSAATPFSLDASLGTAGMGLAALCLAQPLSGSTVTVDALTGIGRFLLLLQKSSGEFYDQYVTGQGATTLTANRPHPGEAILGLVYLYEATNDATWLVAAGKGLSFLAVSHANAATVPADYWSAIAMQRFVPHYAASQCSSTLAVLEQYVTQIADAILAVPAVLDGSATLKVATRLEGLAAAYQVLATTASAAFLASIQSTAATAAAKLVAAQVKTGTFTGAMTREMATASTTAKGSSVRIDYVHHALTALMAYESIA